MANELATRLTDYAAGLSHRVLDAFDPSERRQNYIYIQRVLADLRLCERSELGRSFDSTAEASGRSTGICLRNGPGRCWIRSDFHGPGFQPTWQITHLLINSLVIYEPKAVRMGLMQLYNSIPVS